jgi:hypothetical protein
MRIVSTTEAAPLASAPLAPPTNHLCIIAALVDAVEHPENYALEERDGELFLTPTPRAEPRQ